MSHPFSYVNGEPIDLTKQSHRDEVIKRNKTLETALKNGIDYHQVKITVCLNVELKCLKCGTNLEADETTSLDELNDLNDLYKNIPNINCAHCHTKYNYSLEAGEFFPKLTSKSPQL